MLIINNSQQKFVFTHSLSQVKKVAEGKKGLGRARWRPTRCQIWTRDFRNTVKQALLSPSHTQKKEGQMCKRLSQDANHT